MSRGNKKKTAEKQRLKEHCVSFTGTNEIVGRGRG
jgi:hypothetical protein